MQKTEIKITDDGSHTLFVPGIDECYHSTKGAVQESKHVFIDAGLRKSGKTVINVLEVGFGTGLNTLLTIQYLENQLTTGYPDSEISESNQSGTKRLESVSYTAIELYPVTPEKALELNYPEITDLSTRRLFEKIHTSGWNEPIQITENFRLLKLKADFTTDELNEKFDVIYFDAFSPEKQPEMWTEEIFKKLYHCASDEAVLTTYCAKGAVRRAMISAGFSVERLPGPPGKREILRAVKQI